MGKNDVAGVAKSGKKRDAAAEIEENKLFKKEKLVSDKVAIKKNKEESSIDEDSSCDQDEKPKVQATKAPAPAAAKKKEEFSDDDDDAKPVRLDFARERGDTGDRGAFTPQRRGGTIMIRCFDTSSGIQGFDTSSGIGDIWGSLVNHFSSCGKISRVYIPDAAKGIAFMDFADAESFGKALGMNKSKLGRKYLEVDTQGGTIMIHGLDPSSGRYVFDTSSGIGEFESSLVNHFSSCGEMSSVHIPLDNKGAAKGIAFMMFNDAESLCKALWMDKSKLGRNYLEVDGARPRIRGPRGGARDS